MKDKETTFANNIQKIKKASFVNSVLYFLSYVFSSCSSLLELTILGYLVYTFMNNWMGYTLFIGLILFAFASRILVLILGFRSFYKKL